MRCIHIFPKGNFISALEEIRKAYDPLYGLIDPHITLVFPFESNHELEDLIQVLKAVKIPAFDAEIYDFKCVDNYIFALVRDEQKHIETLHHRLYQGPLEVFKIENDFKEYLPHITLGRFQSHEAAEKAYKQLSFNGPYHFKVDCLSIEEILEDKTSLIVYEEYLEDAC